jgi:hypothetical protein
MAWITFYSLSREGLVGYFLIVLGLQYKGNPGSYCYTMAHCVAPSRGHACLLWPVLSIVVKATCRAGRRTFCLSWSRLSSHNGVASHDGVTTLMSLCISSPPVSEPATRVLEAEPATWGWAGMLCPCAGSRRFASVGLACGQVTGWARPDVFSDGLGTVGVDSRH